MTMRCPTCGASSPIVSALPIEVGARMTVGDLAAAGFTAVGDGARILLEDGPCHVHGAFVIVEVVGEAIATVRVAIATAEELEQVAYLPPAGAGFYRWIDGLFDPAAAWPPLQTTDARRALATRVRLHHPIGARDRLEAQLVLATYGLRATGAWTSIDPARRRWSIEVATQTGSAITVVFDLVDERATPGAGASRVAPPDVFLAAGAQLATTTTASWAELDPTERDEARARLVHAASLVDEVVAAIPDGVEAVPQGAFWGDVARSYRARRPDRYSRARLASTAARWRAEAATPPEGRAIARSAEEARVYMELHACPRCRTETPFLPGHLVDRDGVLVSRYEGPCSGCARVRRFELELADPLPPPETPDAIRFGDGRSSLLDPGQWLVVAERYAKRVPASADGLAPAARARAAWTLKLAIGALDEALAFLAPGEVAITEATITSRAGWIAYDLDPGRFRRDRIIAVRGAYVGVLRAFVD